MVSCQQRLSSSAFEPPKIPRTLSSSVEKTIYLADHYWDSFAFEDTSMVVETDVLGKLWMDYVEILSLAPSDVACRSLVKMLHRAEANKSVFVSLTELSDMYFYQSDSPYRSDSLYRCVLEVESVSSLTSDVEKILPKSRLALLNKNCEGEAAENFFLTDARGAKSELYALDTPYILLFFHDPDCHACEEMKEEMKKNKLLRRLIEEKKLSLLAFYPYGNVDVWKEQLPSYPEKWIVAYDEKQTILNEERYDLKTVPCLYLLDSAKIVLLKEPSLREVKAYLKAKL